ncbi:MAG: biopolymer transporter ExbD [Gammaproteobacteria bacterium]|nr:biopolymer transporter ExbD [Gammaproteobacteria bacterium]
MNFRPAPDEEPEINLIPLIDVLLMTLIFLIVTTSFAKESRLQVRLPEAAPQTTPDKPSLRVTIDAKGQYYINNQELLNSSAETLRNAIARAAGNGAGGINKDQLIVIHADAKSPHESVVRVMDAARRLGLTQLTFATQQPAESAK